ncbi:hypothetical protein FACS1894158_09540 [Betaproteobacteria bacterium]|nr:hypothetical protein FACS1894158_09540 [Betaproteobacteria bacterium]
MGEEESGLLVEQFLDLWEPLEQSLKENFPIQLLAQRADSQADLLVECLANRAGLRFSGGIGTFLWTSRGLCPRFD